MKRITQLFVKLFMCSLVAQAAMANNSLLKEAVKEGNAKHIVALVKAAPLLDLSRIFVEIPSGESNGLLLLRAAVIARIFDAVVTTRPSRSPAELAADPDGQPDCLQDLWRATERGSLGEMHAHFARLGQDFERAIATPEGQAALSPYVQLINSLGTLTIQPSEEALPSYVESDAAPQKSRKRSWNAHHTGVLAVLDVECPDDVVRAVHAGDIDSIRKIQKFFLTATDEQLQRLKAEALNADLKVRRLIRKELERRQSLPLAVTEPSEPPVADDPTEASLMDLAEAADSAQHVDEPPTLSELADDLVPVVTRDWTSEEGQRVRQFLIQASMEKRVDLIYWVMTHAPIQSLYSLLRSLPKQDLVLEWLKFCREDRIVELYQLYLLDDVEFARRILARFGSVILSRWPVFTPMGLVVLNNNFHS